MTKYEFETELKKNIRSLPSDEIKRVLEYYGELFEDMAERGKSEREIINEFGNPSDVANKILSEYDGELREEAQGAEPQENKEPAPKEEKSEKIENAEKGEKGEKGEKAEVEPEAKKPTENITVENRKGGIDGARLALFVTVNVLTGGAFFIVVGVVWILLGVAVVCGGAFAVGGAVGALSSLAVMFTGHAGAGIAQLGVSVALAGLGILTVLGGVLLIRLYFKFNKIIFGGIKKLLSKGV